MQSVLVIDSEEWVSTMLTDALREAGFQAVSYATAQDGLVAATRTSPACIVCELGLPDHHASWLTERLRAEQSDVSVTPILFLIGENDDEDDIEGVCTASDAVMNKPFSVDEVIAKVAELAKTSPQLRSGHRNTRPPVGGPGALVAGSLRDTSVRTLLAVTEMERRDGLLEILGDGQYLSLVLSGGFAISGSVDGEPATPLLTVRKMMACKSGNFTIKNIPPQPPPSGSYTIRQLVALVTGESPAAIAPKADDAPARAVAPARHVVPPPARPPSQVVPMTHRSRPTPPRADHGHEPAPSARTPGAPVPYAPPPPRAPLHTEPLHPGPLQAAAAPAGPPGAAEGRANEGRGAPPPREGRSAPHVATPPPAPTDGGAESSAIDALFAGLEGLDATAASDMAPASPAAPGRPPESTDAATGDAELVEELEEEVYDVEPDLSSYRPPSKD
jgi:two-component system OmpR family response regulator